MNLVKSLAVLVMFSVSQGAYAFCSEEVHSNQLGLVGLDSESGNVFAYIKEPKADSTCGCQAARFKSKFSKPEMALEVLLASKVEGYNNIRIDFNDDVAGTAICNQAVRIYID